MENSGLVVIESHPIQYHAPVYRALEQELGVPVTAIYGSDFSVVGYRDAEFGADFAWDSDLLSGYTSVFLERLESGGAKSAEEVTSRGMRESLRRARPRAIMLVGYGSRFSRAAILRALAVGCPLFLRAEATDHAQTRRRLKGLVRDSMLKLFYSRLDGILYVGKRAREHFLRLGCPENKLIFSPYCVDVAPFRVTDGDRQQLREPTRSLLGILPHQKALLYSGKLSGRKGVDILVESIRKLPASIRKDVVLVFLGDGDLRQELEESAAREPGVAVRFVGFQNQSRLSAYYHAADLLILPSIHSETWGLAINEAMHHGIAAVVSQGVGCGPDLIESGVTGEVCSTGNAGSLADAIRRALVWCTTPEARDRCRARVAGYTVHEAAKGIAQAYHRVIETKQTTVLGQPS